MAEARRPLLLIGALVTVLTILLAACGKETSKTSEGTTTPGGAVSRNQATIAFVGAKTGDKANLGINIRDGVKLAVDQANKSGQEPRIELKEFDTAGDPAQAGTVKDQFINEASIIGIVGPAFSGETKAVLPALNEAGLVMISASATNKDLPNVVPGGKVFHRALADDSFQGRGIAQFLTQSLKAKNVAVIDDNTEYGKGLSDSVAQAVGTSGGGGKVVDRERVDPNSQDFSAAVNAVKKANPDVIFYGGYYQESGRLKKQLTDAGVTARFVSGDGALDPGFIAAAGPAAANGAILSCPCNLATATSPGALGQFYKDYKAAFAKDPGTYSSEGYDATNILVNGIRSGNNTREKLLNYVNNSVGTYDGISKKLQFKSNGDITATSIYVFDVKDGQLAYRETIDVK